MQYLIAFSSRPEAASDVISDMFVKPILLDTCAKFHDLCLNRSPEMSPEAVGGGSFDSFFRCSFLLEVDNDLISGVAVDYIKMDVHAKLGDSRSNLSCLQPSLIRGFAAS